MHQIIRRSAMVAALALAPWIAMAQDAPTLPPQNDQPTHQVPEPGSLALAGLALAASLALRVRRARRSKQGPG